MSNETNNNQHETQIHNLEKETVEVGKIIRELQERQNKLYKNYEDSGRSPEYYNSIATEFETLTCDIHGYIFQQDNRIEELLSLQEEIEEKGKEIAKDKG